MFVEKRKWTKNEQYNFHEKMLVKFINVYKMIEPEMKVEQEIKEPTKRSENKSQSRFVSLSNQLSFKTMSVFQLYHYLNCIA